MAFFMVVSLSNSVNIDCFIIFIKHYKVENSDVKLLK